MYPILHAVTAAHASDARRGTVKRVPVHALVIDAQLPLRPQDLLDARITLRTALHPYAAAHFATLGRRLRNGAWSFPRAAVDGVLAVLDNPSATGVSVHLRARTAHLHVAESSVVLTLDAAEDVLVGNRLPVFDGSSGAFAAWRALRDRALLARAQPGSPNLARLVDGATERVLSCTDALAVLDREPDRSIACDALVAEIADLSRAPAVDDPALTAPQRAAVGRYLSSTRGVLCAMPPGTGKTVVAARALHHSNERALVVAPSSLHRQWMAEIARFHPLAELLVLGTGRQREAAAHLARPHAVLLASPAVIARHRHLAPDVLVIDEATYLRNLSKRTAALREIRSRSRRALLLTGTPAARTLADVGTLTGFVLGDHSLFAAAPTGEDWRDRLGPLVCESADQTLPRAHRTLRVCRPTAAERAAIRAANETLRAARGALALGSPDPRTAFALRTAAQSAFEAARLAATDATALPGLPAALHVGNSTKFEHLARILADPTPTLVFCDTAHLAASLADRLVLRGIRAASLSPTLSARARTALLTGFPSAHDVLVLPSASHLGLNLQAASRVVHYDVPLTVSSARQREGRARRMGGGEVEVLCLVLRGGIDEDAARAWATSSPDTAIA